MDNILEDSALDIQDLQKPKIKKFKEPKEPKEPKEKKVVKKRTKLVIQDDEDNV